MPIVLGLLLGEMVERYLDVYKRQALDRSVAARRSQFSASDPRGRRCGKAVLMVNQGDRSAIQYHAAAHRDFFLPGVLRANLSRTGDVQRTGAHLKDVYKRQHLDRAARA